MKLTKETFYQALSQVESSGIGFYQRGSDNTINIYVRPADRQGSNLWPDAREVEAVFSRYMLESIKPDAQSGCLVIRIKDKFAE